MRTRRKVVQSLGSVLRKARASRNLTIREAGEKLGMSPGYLSEIETGKKVPDKEGTLEGFAALYSIDVLELRLLASLKNEKQDVHEFELDDFRLKVARKMLTEDPQSEMMQKLRRIFEGEAE